MNVNIIGLDLSDGKNVLLIAPDYFEQSDCIQLKQILAAKFPNCEFVIIGGDFQIMATTSSPEVYQIGGEYGAIAGVN